MSKNELSCTSLIPQKLNRRDEIRGASAAVTIDSMDAVVELTWTYLQRVTAVFAHTPLEAIDRSGTMIFTINNPTQNHPK